MSDRYVVRRIEDVGVFTDEERARWHPIRTELGITAFGINAWRASGAGQELIEEHDEVGGGAGGHEELYVVLSGRATFTVDGETVDAPAGQLVFVSDPAVKRSAVAAEAGTTVLVAGGKRGEAFSVSPWERYAEGLRFFATKEYDRALEFFEEAHREASRPGRRALQPRLRGEPHRPHRRGALASRSGDRAQPRSPAPPRRPTPTSTRSAPSRGFPEPTTRNRPEA